PRSAEGVHGHAGRAPRVRVSTERPPVPSNQMLERLADLEKEYDDVLRRLSDPDVIADQRALRDESRRHKQLEPVVQRFRGYRAAIDQLAEAKEMLASSS